MAANQPDANSDDLLASLNANFGDDHQDAVRQSKKNSLAEMTKSLPDWSLEPPETFLS